MTETLIFTKRPQIENEAKKRIESLTTEIKKQISGKESEFFYFVPNFYLGAFEGLSRFGKPSKDIVTKRDPTWWRGTNSFIGALQTILPSIIPLKTFRQLSIERLKEIFDNHIFETTFQELIVLGSWVHIEQDTNVRSVKVENGVPQPFTNSYSTSWQLYVNKVSSSDEGTRVMDQLYSKLFSDVSMRTQINASLMSHLGFSLDNLVNATEFLREIVQEKPIHIYPRNKLQEVFQKNIRSAEADKLFQELVFDDGKSLRTSPLVPVVGGQLLVLPWILNLGSVFDELLRSAMSERSLSGKIADFMGKTAFEQYVTEKVQNLGIAPIRNIEVKVGKYPEIATILGKNTGFELDLLVSSDKKGYVISCKGGKKELPKLSYDQQWAEFPESDIRSRICDNIKDMEEISRNAQCFGASQKLSKDHGVDGKEMIPVVVYASIQPLSVDEVKRESGVHSDTIVTTPDGLREILDMKSP